MNYSVSCRQYHLPSYPWATYNYFQSDRTALPPVTGIRIEGNLYFEFYILTMHGIYVHDSIMQFFGIGV
jgi:hypothetical protein